jgi:hypothetical protein
VLKSNFLKENSYGELCNWRREEVAIGPRCQVVVAPTFKEADRSASSVEIGVLQGGHHDPPIAQRSLDRAPRLLKNLATNVRCFTLEPIADE